MEYEIGDNEAVSTAVVRAVSAVDGRDPCSIPLLNEVIDPDALDILFAPSFTGEPRAGGRLSFVYNNCRVTIDNDEYITIELLENRQDLRNRADSGPDTRR